MTVQKKQQKKFLILTLKCIQNEGNKMNISPVNSTSFGKVYIKTDKDTKRVLKDFIVDVDSADYFRKSFSELNEASNNRDMELSAKKGKSLYAFSLKELNSTKEQMVAVPISNVKLLSERKKHLQNIMEEFTINLKKH